MTDAIFLYYIIRCESRSVCRFDTALRCAPEASLIASQSTVQTERSRAEEGEDPKRIASEDIENMYRRVRRRSLQNSLKSRFPQKPIEKPRTIFLPSTHVYARQQPVQLAHIPIIDPLHTSQQQFHHMDGSALRTLNPNRRQMNPGSSTSGGRYKSRYARNGYGTRYRDRMGEGEEQEGLLRTGDAREEELDRERAVEVGEVNGRLGGSHGEPQVSGLWIR